MAVIICILAARYFSDVVEVSWSTLLWSLAALLLASMLALKLWSGKAHPMLPSGPRGLPLLGNLLAMRRNFHRDQFLRWAAQYGPVFMIKLVGVRVVVLNDYESVKKFLTRRELQDRSWNWRLRSETAGLSGLNGQAWRENRRLCMQAMVELGYGKDEMRTLVQSEVRHLVEKLTECGSAPVAVRPLLAASIANCVAFYLFGYRFDLDDSRRMAIDRQIDAVFVAAASMPVDFLPTWLKRLARNFTPASLRGKHFAEELAKFSRELIKIAQETKNESRHRSLIDVYLSEMHKQAPDENSTLTMSRLIGNVTDILIGGTASGTVYLHWHLINLAAHPDTLQADLQKEIDAIVGRGRKPAWEDHTYLPLTMATIWEMFRWKTVPPLSVPRCASEDVTIEGVFIPKGTTVVANLWAVNMDPKTWKDPAKFDPYRFVQADGSVLTSKPENVIPFTVGKRHCPGEALAITEMFLYLTHLLHEFRILPEEVQSFLQVESFSCSSNDLANVKLRFLKR